MPLSRPIDTSTAAVVLKMVRDDYAHGRLGVVRSLGRLGVAVHAVHESRWTPAAFSRFDRGRILLPVEDPPVDDMLERLIAVGEGIGLPVLIPTDDVGALFVDDNLDELRRAFLVAPQVRGLPARLANKAELHNLCAQFGVPSPASMIPTSREDLVEFAAGASYPVMVKSMDPRILRLRQHAVSVAMATSPSELVGIYDLTEQPREPNLLFQEYIPGGPGASWALAAYVDATGRCSIAATGRKIRDEPPGRGGTSYGIAEPNPELENVALPFFAALGYRGILGTCWRWDARDGTYKLLDANPRVGANFRLFVSDELDVVRALYLDLTGQTVTRPAPPSGRTFVVEPFDLRSVRAQHPRPVRWGTWLGQVVRADEKAWWAPDDPLPALAVLLFTVAKVAYDRLRNLPVVGPAVQRFVARRRVS